MVPILKGGLAFRSRKFSFCLGRSVLTEVSGAVNGRSYGSSAPCEVAQSPRTRRYVTKDERLAMTESFVNKYKATNEGKLPSITAIQKEVGGNFYTIRMIFQELKYKSKASIPRSRNETPILDAKTLSVSEVVSSAVTNIQHQASTLCSNYEKRDQNVEPHGGSQISDHSRSGTSDDDVESNSQAEISDQVEKQMDQLGEVKVDASQSIPGETKGTSKSCKIFVGVDTRKRRMNANSVDSRNADPDEKQRKSEISKLCESQQLVKDETDGRPKAGSETSNQKKQAVSGNLKHPDDKKPNIELNHDALDLAKDETKMTETEYKKKAGGRPSLKSKFPENKTEQSQDSKQVEKDARDMSERQADVAKKSNLWGNLKSFADGLVSIWRKW